MPSHDTVKEHKYLKMFGSLLHDPNLFHLNRRSAAGAFAVGLFVCFMPIPFQMVVAATFAMLFKVNLPLSVALVWISNPITMPLLFSGAYMVGATLVGEKAREFEFELTWEGLMHSFTTLGPAFLTGCLICAVFFSALGYFGIRALWRYSVTRNWKKRQCRWSR